MNQKKMKIPPIGLRIIKSSIAVLLCYLVSILRGDAGIVFYSQIAALWCMHHYIKNSKKLAIQRFIGTIIGAIFGLFVIIIEKQIGYHISMQYDIVFALFVSFMIIPVIYTTVILKRNDAAYFSCVVFLSIVVIHIIDQNPYLFVWNRFLDTVIGLIIGISINYAHLPRDKKNDFLLIADLDDQFEFVHTKFTPYERVELNRMIESGLHFTIFSRSTPASLIEPLRDIELKLPVIGMDGAVLYDTAENRFVRTYVISREKARILYDLIHEFQLKSFCNVIIEDMVMIYYEDSDDFEYCQLIDRMRRSPYRNYVKRVMPENEEVVYFMILDKNEKIKAFYKRLKEEDYLKELKVVTYIYDINSNYSVLRIYNKNATKNNMIDYLKHDLQMNQVVNLGTKKEDFDYTISNRNNNHVIKSIRKIYEPVKFRKQNKKKE